MRFGLVFDFRNPERWQRPPGEVYEGLLRQCELAEELGFDSIWITEHHLADDGYTPSPIPLLAAIAARTKRVRLSTDIMLLPLYHGVKLAEDAATVDIISNGRLELGFGMGYRDVEFELFGQRRMQRARRMEEGLAVLRGCWGDAPFSFEGEFYSLRDANVTPKPVQPGGPPLWMAATSEAAARRAARHGLNLLPQSDRRAAYDPWLDELAKLGRDPKAYRIGLIKSAFVTGSDPDPVWQEARERERYRWATYGPWIAHGGGYVKPLPGEPEMIDQQWMVGPSSKVIDQIERLRESLPVTDLISWGCPPGMDPRAMTPTLERFARDIIPHFKRKTSQG